MIYLQIKSPKKVIQGQRSKRTKCQKEKNKEKGKGRPKQELKSTRQSQKPIRNDRLLRANGINCKGLAARVNHK